MSRIYYLRRSNVTLHFIVVPYEGKQEDKPSQVIFAIYADGKLELTDKSLNNYYTKNHHMVDKKIHPYVSEEDLPRVIKTGDSVPPCVARNLWKFLMSVGWTQINKESCIYAAVPKDGYIEMPSTETISIDNP